MSCVSYKLQGVAETVLFFYGGGHPHCEAEHVRVEGDLVIVKHLDSRRLCVALVNIFFLSVEGIRMVKLSTCESKEISL